MFTNVFCCCFQSFANVMIGRSYFSQLGVNLLVRQTDTHPLVPMTAKEFMFGYESTLVTLGYKVLPNWITFDKLGLIDRVSKNYHKGLLLLRVREVFCPRRRPHTGPIEL